MATTHPKSASRYGLAILTLAVVACIAVIAFLFTRVAAPQMQVDLDLPSSEQLPGSAPMPNPQPLPSPLRKPG